MRPVTYLHLLPRPGQGLYLLQHRALIGGGQLLDELDTSAKAGSRRRDLLRNGLQSQELIRGDHEGDGAAVAQPVHR